MMNIFNKALSKALKLLKILQPPLTFDLNKMLMLKLVYDVWMKVIKQGV